MITKFGEWWDNRTMGTTRWSSRERMEAMRAWDHQAERIAELEAENERLTAIIDNAPLDELHGCDCCGATTTDAVEADGHMQCRACTLEAQLATARAEGEQRVLREFAEWCAKESGGHSRLVVGNALLDYRAHLRAQAKQGEP